MNVGNIFIKSHVKVPAVLRVIKKKDPEPSPWWSPYINRDTYYSGVFNDQQYIYSFFNEHSAERCISFLKHYKKIHGHYPTLTKSSLHVKRMSNYLLCNIQSEEETVFSLKERCLTNGIGLIGIVNFDYSFIDSFFGSKNVFNLHLSAINLLEDSEPDLEKQVDNLNFILDF